MPTNFPGAVDSLTNPTATDALTSPSHADQHININDGMEAVQAHVLPSKYVPVESGGASADKSTISTTFVDIGAPFDQSVTAPPSGRVLILAILDVRHPDPTNLVDVVIGYQIDAGADVTIGGHAFDVETGGNNRLPFTAFDVATGLTPGVSYSFSLRWLTSSGTARIEAGTRGASGSGSRMLLLPLA